jgi:hypothetical protein
MKSECFFSNRSTPALKVLHRAVAQCRLLIADNQAAAALKSQHTDEIAPSAMTPMSAWHGFQRTAMNSSTEAMGLPQPQHRLQILV